MIQGEQMPLRISIVVINLLSIMGCFLILWTFQRVKRLTQNPGKIIMRISLLQMIFSIILMLSQFYYTEKTKDNQQLTIPQDAFFLNNQSCDGIAFLTLTVSLLFNYYNILFVYFLFNVLLQQKSNQNFEKNFQKYELIAIIISLIYSGAFYVTGQLGDGFLGDCNVVFDSSKAGQLVNSAISLVILILLLVVITLIICKMDKIQFKQEIYNIDSVKFQQKYLKHFLINNVLYVGVFIIVRVIPIVISLIFIYNAEQSQSVFQQSTLILVSIGGVLLFMVRANEPIVNKYIKRQLICCNNQQSLNEKLILRNKQSSSMADPLMYNPQDRCSLEITLVDNLTQSNSVKVPKQLLSSIFSHKKVKAELALILMTVREAIKTEIPNKKFIQENCRPYNFLQIKVKKFGVKNSLKEIEAHIQVPQIDKTSSTIGSENPPEPYWEQLIVIDDGVENYPIQLQCFQYASDYLLSILKTLNISQEQILKSLFVENNMRRLSEVSSQTEAGQQFITEDGLISIDFITRKQKTLLTREGGLLNLFKIWSELHFDTKELTTHAPLVLGVMTVQLEHNRCISMCIRLNWIWLEYPISSDAWEKRQWKKSFEKKNVIGWIEVSPDLILKRFLASSALDGKFQIKLQESDFKVSRDDQILLIDNLQRDLKTMVKLGNKLTLTFVYFKFSTQRLISLVTHEKNDENILNSKIKGALEKEVIIYTPNAMNSTGVIGKYQLDSRIGFVKVFFDQIFYQDQIKELDMQLECEKLVQRVTDII